MKTKTMAASKRKLQAPDETHKAPAGFTKESGGRTYYVRYPVLVSQEMLAKFPKGCVKKGQWVPVNVVEGEYQHLTAPVGFNTFDDCWKSCQQSNRLVGFTDDEATAIIAKSMGL